MGFSTISRKITKTQMQYRQDAVKVDSVRIDEFGILRAKAKIARIGTMDYYENGKKIVELRLPDDVRESVNTFSYQLITLDHPTEMVDAKNADRYVKGLSGEAKYNELTGWNECPVTVTHGDAVDAARSTHKQFSCGYYAELIDESGEWVDVLGVQGEPGQVYRYDRIQKNIIGNHIALVSSARAGDRATFDSAGFIITQDKENKVTNMVQFVHNDSILTIEGQDADKVVEIVKGLQSKLDSEISTSAETLGNLEAENETLKAEKSTLEGKVDSLEAQKEQDNSRLDSDAIASEVAARLDMWGLVEPHLKSVKRDNNLSAIEIQKLYLKQALPNLAEKIDSSNDNYIAGLWDAQKPEPVKVKTHSDITKEILKDSTNEPQENKLDAARNAYLESRMNFLTRNS